MLFSICKLIYKIHTSANTALKYLSETLIEVKETALENPKNHCCFFRLSQPKYTRSIRTKC